MAASYSSHCGPRPLPSAASLRRNTRLPHIALQLAQKSVTGLSHDLAYRAIADGSIDVTDLYSTDAEIDYYHLRVLEDDRHHFPLYKAVILSRADLAGPRSRIRRFGERRHCKA